jgi:SAM-dependent methyltransferase
MPVPWVAMTPSPRKPITFPDTSMADNYSPRVVLKRLHRKLFVRPDPFLTFLEPNALAINEARMSHLATLGLPIEGRSVLEVGAGIGLLTSFFEERGCVITSTDARRENIRENLRRHPHRRVLPLDLERPEQVERFGKFDIVFCYGTLYHLATPEASLEALSRVSHMVLLETCLSAGDEDVAPTVRELNTASQAFSEVGSRPTRRWVLDRLNRFWGHGYMSVTQPSHPDFPLDFTEPARTANIRAIFVGSRKALDNPLLSSDVPRSHRRVSSTAPAPLPPPSAART